MDKFEMYAHLLDDFDEDEPDVAIDTSGLHVFSRDWTIESVAGQIEKGNIDLAPDFQRRNVWDDAKRSALIESIILDLPIPEIVLAEHPKDRKKYIVLDGKQRLLSIVGFVLEQKSYCDLWDNHGKLRKLRILQDCNGLNYFTLKEEFPDFGRMLDNGTVRCTVIGGYTNENVLYEIFFRLNTGSSPLSPQELRNVLHSGEFNKYLFEITEKKNPLHCVLNLDGPDKRLRDIEILLRMASFALFASNYNGNLKLFLDNTSDSLNKCWKSREMKERVCTCIDLMFDAIEKLKIVFGEYNKVGRKFTNGSYETRINRVLLEVETLIFMQAQPVLSKRSNRKFVELFQRACTNNGEFRRSIESTTKTMKSYGVRYTTLADLVNQAYDTSVMSPFPIQKD